MLITERLIVAPLTLSQLSLLDEDQAAFERETGYAYDGEKLEGFMREYLREQIRIIGEDSSQWLWTAFWLMILKQEQVVIGSLAFKGKPKLGEVELGYGLAPRYERMGYMTEAAKALSDWALAQPGVASVIAETELDGHGPASQRVLAKCGFTRYRFGDASWWRKTK